MDDSYSCRLFGSEGIASQRGWNNQAVGYSTGTHKRYLLTFIIFVGCCVIYTQRASLNLAIVEMVNKPHKFANLTVQNNEDSCPAPRDNSTINSITNNTFSDPLKFNWSPLEEGIILGGFYYGYTASNVIGGLLSQRWGPKITFLLGLGVSALLTLLTPVAAHWHIGALIAVRALMGIAHGLTFPAIFTFFSVWYPKNEVSTHLAIGLSGLQVGTIISMIATGYLCKQTVFAGGWPSVFYVFGITSVLYTVLGWFTIYSSPEEHPTISQDELKLINAEKPKVNKKNMKPPVPWRSLLTSPPVWALVVNQATSVYAFHVILTKLPAYMDDLLHYSVQDNGVLNSVFYLTKGIMTVVVGFLADLTLKKQFYSRTVTRKAYETVAMLGMAVFTFTVPWIGCSGSVVVIILAMSMAVSGFNAGGHVPAATEIAPPFSGTIFGISNTFSASTGFLAPMIVGLILEGNPGSLSRWNTVFYSCAGSCAFGLIIFLIFGSAEKQKWASVNEEEEEKDNTKVETELQKY